MNALLEATYVADQYYENPDNLYWDKFNNYAVVNLKINYRFSKILNWYVRAENLFDTLYENDYGVPMPGREFLTGIRLSL